ncbi:orotidine 5'-phosphate decarboxylase [Candidatus Micrarchaeota archaeon]|nr:orotidine 5'-phosphate decarboxylase [Candidatus Micrarchaeota archaeon]
MSIIGRDRSIVIACDAPLNIYKKILEQTADIGAVGGYKLGFYLGLRHGLPKLVKLTREYTDKPLIYDHQKAATDIPDTGKKFMEVCTDAGIDAVILFPQAGPETEKAWIEAAKGAGLGIIVGGLMTHKAYVKSDGGYIDDGAIIPMYVNAAKLGVTEFVVPGNKPDKITEIRKALEAQGVKPVFHAPGFIAQGGEITDAARAAGERWHAIVGRAVYESKDMRKTVLGLSAQL